MFHSATSAPCSEGSWEPVMQTLKITRAPGHSSQNLQGTVPRAGTVRQRAARPRPPCSPSGKTPATRPGSVPGLRGPRGAVRDSGVAAPSRWLEDQPGLSPGANAALPKPWLIIASGVYEKNMISAASLCLFGIFFSSKLSLS